MAKGPEGRLQARVDELLNNLKMAGAPIWWLKVHGEQRQKGGIPDYVLCVRGKFCTLELKAGVNTPTERQLLTMRVIHQAGGATRVAWNLQQVKSVLDEFFKDEIK